MSTIREFLNGFKLVDYKVELANELVKQYFSPSIVEEILVLSESLLLSNVRFGIHNYHIEKMDEEFVPDKLLKKIEENNGCVSFTKVYNETHPTTYEKETHLSSSIYVLLIDENVWKLSIDAFLVCESPYLDDGDQLVIDFLIKYVNSLLTETKIIKPILYGNCQIDKIVDYQLLRVISFTGYSKIYGDQSLLENIGYDEYLPDKKEEYQTLIDEEDEKLIIEDEKTEEEPIMVDIVHSITSSSTTSAQDVKVIHMM